jgi:hypothetical protein
VRAKDAWVGVLIAEVVGLDPDRQRSQIEQIIKAWLKAGVIKVVSRYDPKRERDCTFVEPGEWSE